MTATKSAADSQAAQRQYSDLDRRYGKIGISAVAAAVRYRSEPPVPVYARGISNERD
jgi:hypothetical protein